MLLEGFGKGHAGTYYQIWYAIEKKGTLLDSAIVLWEFLRDHPGETNMLNRYHCANALFYIIGLPDPVSKLELHKNVQWDHDGEAARQVALVELRELIERLKAGKSA